MRGAGRWVCTDLGVRSEVLFWLVPAVLTSYRHLHKSAWFERIRGLATTRSRIDPHRVAADPGPPYAEVRAA